MTEFRQTEFPSIVVNVTGDPEGYARVQVRVLGLFDGVPDADLPWATYKLPTGSGENRGGFSPCQKNDSVWVDFPFYSHGEPDTRQPRITGSMHHGINGKPNIPHEAIGKGYSHSKSSVKGDYHESKVSTYNQATVEHVKGGTLRIFSNVSGAMVEVSPKGEVLISGAKSVDVMSDEEVNVTAPKLNFNALESHFTGKMYIKDDAIIDGKSFNKHWHKLGITPTTEPKGG